MRTSTVVGYSNGTLQYNKNWMVNMFKEVGKAKDACVLGAIVPGADYDPGSDFVTFLDADGGEDGNCVYLAEAPDDGMDAGWYDLDKIMQDEPEFVCKNDREFPFGTMAIFYALSADGLYNTYSGEVVQGDTTLDLGYNKNWVGNASPVDTVLGKFLPSEDFDPGSDFVTFLDADGGEDGNYVFLAEAPDEGMDAGWYDLDKIMQDEPEFVCANEKSVPAGTGFIFYALSADGLQFTIPGALPAAE